MNGLNTRMFPTNIFTQWALCKQGDKHIYLIVSILLDTLTSTTIQYQQSYSQAERKQLQVAQQQQLSRKKVFKDLY